MCPNGRPAIAPASARWYTDARAIPALGGMKMKIVVIILLLISVSGCTSTLRCGTDGDSSYVDLINVREIPTHGRHYAELCGFAYEVVNEEDE